MHFSQDFVQIFALWQFSGKPAPKGKHLNSNEKDCLITKNRKSENAMFGEIGGLVGGPVAFWLFLHVFAPFLAADFW